MRGNTDMLVNAPCIIAVEIKLLTLEYSGQS